MTPKAIRLVAELRHEFYSLFAANTNVPVEITASSYSTNFPIACWIDTRHQLNYLCVYAHTAPDYLIPSRPLLLRIAINSGAGRAPDIQLQAKCQGFNDWRFELTVLPEEVLDFLPWIISTIETYSQSSPIEAQTPPHPLNFIVPAVGLCSAAWTEEAWSRCEASSGRLNQFQKSIDITKLLAPI